MKLSGSAASSQNSSAETQVTQVCQEFLADSSSGTNINIMSDVNLEFNLCDLLGIDIEAKALAIALAD